MTTACALAALISCACIFGCSPAKELDESTDPYFAPERAPEIEQDSGAPGAESIGLTTDPRAQKDPCDDPEACDCAPVAFTVETQQSCSMSVVPGHALDGEGFINIDGMDHRVFAMNRWGSGHVIAWCDATTLIPLLNAFEATRYLGQTDSPRVASMGYGYLCGTGASTGTVPAAYLGTGLPSRYVDNPYLLAQDWDVLIFCGYGTEWNPEWRTTIERFVSTQGKGFLAVMDYQGAVTQNDFDRMSEITRGAGITFNPLSLPWASASTTVALDCVPDVPDPIR